MFCRWVSVRLATCAKLNGQARPAEHSTVKIALDAGALHVFDRQTGARL
jgi:hypothetical protein